MNVARCAGQRLRLAAVTTLILATALPLSPARAAAEETAARLFAAHALSFRAAGVAGEDAAISTFARMPGAGAKEHLPALWRPFLENAIVKLGRIGRGRTGSSMPVALYYNPLLDIAVLTLWEKTGGRYRVASIRAFPGEHLDERDAAVPLRPRWMGATEGPVAALGRITAARLGAFRRAHPLEAREARRDDATLVEATAGLRASSSRLWWNHAMRVDWAGEQSSWLEPVLGRIDAVLALRDAAAVSSAAPDTDAETASALARLPAAFVADLALDMTLEAGGNDRMMIASAPGDGHVYVLALCRLADGVCALQRFLLISLNE